MMNEHSKNSSSGFAHLAFRIAMIVKGINGLLELVGGTILIFMKTTTIDHILSILSWDQLRHDPDSAIARFLIQVSHHVSLDTKFLTILYLLSHGTIKVILVVGLWTDHKSFFVPGLAFLCLFVLIESYGLLESFSIVLVIVVIVDLLIITSVWLEYRHIS